MNWFESVRERVNSLPGLAPDAFGASVHGFRLGEPLARDVLQQLDPHGRFPEAYRDFLLHVAAWGAGPGYGLLPPVDVCGWGHEFHAAHDWVPNLDDPAERTLVEALGGDYYSDFWLRGCVPLADWGCGIVSLLLISAPQQVRGSVFIDLRWAGLGLRQTHRSFQEFYETWLVSLSEPRGNEAGALDTPRGVNVAIPRGTCANWNALDNFLSAQATSRGTAPADLDAATLAEIFRQIPDAGIAQAVDEDSAYYLSGDRLRACPACTARITSYVEGGLLRWSQLASGRDLRSLRDWSQAT